MAENRPKHPKFLFIAGAACLVGLVGYLIVDARWQSRRVANCRTEQEIVQLLGPSDQTFPAGDKSWHDLCQDWGCRTVRGEPGEGSRAESYGSRAFLLTGYIVFFDGDKVVAVMELLAG